MPSELQDRLNAIYDETIAVAVMANQSNWPTYFGNEMDQVRRIVVHETAGWPRRQRANAFRERYMWTGGSPNTCPTSNCGIGTQFYISNDGTVARLIDLPRRTAHALHVNDAALGVETSNLLDDVSPPNRHWIEASGDANDIPGAKLWITSGLSAHNEVCPCWWTTDAHAGPAREPVGAGFMLFTEWQYRAWALLARYLCERFRLPRNFPLVPHALRADLNDDAALFRRIVLADERAEVMKRIFAAAPYNIAETSFEAANAATLQTEYAALNVSSTTTRREHNTDWKGYIEDDLFRGIQGHGYSGAIKKKFDDKTQCPGPLFDFHRLAREVWDWWWYPFDVNDLGRTDTPYRAYRRWSKLTPLLEYYFDEDEQARNLRLAQGIHGPRSSPATFSLEPDSPIYALANGELVAARFPPTGGGVSLAFALVRHKVFHLPLFANEVAASLGFPSPHPGAIDYDRPPSYVYSLYMHLGRPAAMTFDQVHEDNPDWLNRVLIRKKECDLGIAFYNHPTHHGIADAVWDNRPPGVPQRPTTLEAWRADQTALTRFLDGLRAGRTATAPSPDSNSPLTNLNYVQPIRIILGDFLGKSGVIRREGGVDTHGIRIETFSPSFSPPGFSKADTDGWTFPTQLPAPHSLCYRSEWSRILTQEDTASLQALGVDVNYIDWWPTVALATTGNASLPAAAKLPHLGHLYHYQPLDFMRWINEVTWRHEWPKYGVTDTAGNPVPIVDNNGNLRRPRSRRI